jgi:superoxide dismutase
VQVEFVPLKYAYSDYEPLVDTETMRIHHSGHYKTYTDNLNFALREAELHVPAVSGMSLADLLRQLDNPNEAQPDLRKLPINVSTAILNNGGGYVNHVLFFNQLRKAALAPTLCALALLLSHPRRPKPLGATGKHALSREVQYRGRSYQDLRFSRGL